MSYLPEKSDQPHILSKNSSTRSCQSFICLTQRCQEQEKKEKQKILNSIYFEKLSLKKFHNTSTFNQTFYEKNLPNPNKKRDKSTQDSDFKNINLPLHQREPQCFVSENKYFENNQRMASYSQFQHQKSTHRIIRSSSYTLLNNQPQLKSSTDRSIKNEIKQDLQKIQVLSNLRLTLQREIQQLDQNIDKYYHVYNAKLQELKKIQMKLKQIESEGQKTLSKTPSTDNLCGQFKKKLYPDEISFGSNYHLILNNREKKPNDKIHNNFSNKKIGFDSSQVKSSSPKYCSNTNMTYVKKN